jgi:hypothetical protein
VSFAQLPDGWRGFPAAGGALATSWPYRPGPGGWATKIPRNGIAVSVFFVRDTPAYPPLRLRLAAKTRFVLDGAPDTPEYRVRGRVRGHNVEIHVDIRNPHPSRARVRLAQRVVAAIRFG